MEVILNLRAKIVLATSLSLLVAVEFAHSRQQEAPNSVREPSTQEEIHKFNDEKLVQLAKEITGREGQRADVVFKNIKTLNGVSAGTLLKIMEIGYAKSLGVACTHCHIPGEWEKDDKPPKQIARDMSKMVQVINVDLLRNIEGLKQHNPLVNCTTCHRGQVKPALNLDAAGGK